MSDRVETAAVVLLPSDDLTFPDKDERLTHATGGEDHNSVPLQVGRYATLVNGAVPIRYSLRRATGGATQVATTSRILNAYAEISWFVTDDTKVVYTEAADAATEYECWVANTSS